MSKSRKKRRRHRERVAAACLTALLAKETGANPPLERLDALARLARDAADALLAALDETAGRAADVDSR